MRLSEAYDLGVKEGLRLARTAPTEDHVTPSGLDAPMPTETLRERLDADGRLWRIALEEQRVAPTEDVRQIVAVLASRLGHVETHWVPDDRATPMLTAEVLREFDAALTAHDAEVRAQVRVSALEDLMATAEDRGYKYDVPMIFIEEVWHVLSARAERGEA